MKELTIEQKAKAYDEAIKRIENIKTGKCETTFLFTEGLFEHIFPELKEPNDEKIRKELIDAIQGLWDDDALPMPLSVKRKDAWLTWLEKQGEQKSAERKDFISIPFGAFDSELVNETITIPDGCVATIEGNRIHIKKEGKSALEAIKEEKIDNANKVEPKFKVGDIVQYITDSTDRRKIEEVDTLCNMYHTDSSPIMFEIEDEWKVVVNAEDVEQNLTDEGIKAEPNLKVGDWIVRTNGESFCNGNKFAQIESIELDGEMCYLDTGRWLYTSEIRLWTIYDAQDGDLIYVSTEEKSIGAIFDKFDNGIIYFHCYICGDFTQGGYMSMDNVELIYPWQKANHQRLFQKMREEGYEWDSEKKKLKKIMESNETN